MPFRQFHRVHVDRRVLPDLGIYEAGEEQAEQALGKAVRRQGLVLEEGVLELAVALQATFFDDICHDQILPHHEFRGV
ncbi:hypothetical protein D3C87_1995050 [compost metagenome]